MGLGLNATAQITERWTNTLLVLAYFWDLMTTRKMKNKNLIL